MATLEAVRRPLSPSQDDQQQLDESRHPNVPSTKPTGVDLTTFSTTIFPAVPAHDPRNVLKRPNTAAVEGLPEHTEGVVVKKPLDDNKVGKMRNEEEMEEVLEELQDDEIEEMADEGGYSYDSLAQLLGQELETLPLLNAVQSVCIGAIQSLLRSMSANSSQIPMSGGKEAVESLIKASDTAAASVMSAHATSAATSADIQWDSENPLQNFSTLLKQTQFSTAGMEADIIEDVSLLTALRDLIISINTTKSTVEELDGQLQLENMEAVSPTSSQASSMSPKDMSAINPASLSQQQLRAQRVQGLGRLTIGAPSSSLIGSSPSMSREELRNPFSDSDTRPQSALSEDRYRERTDRDLESSTRLMKMLDNLDKRCIEIVAGLSSSVKGTIATERSEETSFKDKEEVVKTWRQLQSLSKGTRDVCANRRSSASTLPSLLETRRGSGSPNTYSPTYSPSRGRSRRNSGTSLYSVTAASLNSIEAGDPTGEAVAAGVGVGARRSLSRLSNNSNRGGHSATGLPSTSSPLMGSLVSRRESTKSDGTASYSVHSPPPRYSEESSRNWAGIGWSLPEGDREVDVNVGGMQEFTRTRSQSSGDQSAFSTRVLPAYNTNDATYRSSIDKKGSSTSSLIRFDSNNLPTKVEEKGERSRSASDGAKMSGMIGGSLALQGIKANQFNASASEYQARTSQDLSMLQASIDRLYSAVPQLEDQRSCSPLEIKQRQAQKQDEMLQLIEKLSKGGRMEDQRAMPPMESSNRISSVAASPDLSAEASSGGAPLNSRLAKRLGSITFGSLSLRRAASALGSEGKGKERERVDDAAFEENVNRADYEDLVNQVQAARDRGYEDQRVQLRTKEKGTKKPSKLDLMGVSNFDDDENRDFRDDDDLFDALSASLASGRMSDQDAVKRSSPYRTKNTQVVLSNMAGQESSTISSSSTPHRLEANSEIVANPSSPSTKLPVGESIDFRREEGERTTDSSVRGLRKTDNNSQKGAAVYIPLSYIAESQPRLGYVSVFLWTKSNDSPDSLSYQLNSTNDHLLIVTYHQTSYSFTLPCQALRGQQGVLMKQQDHWYFKLQMAQPILNSAIEEASAPLGALTLQKIRPSSLSCNICLRKAAETESVTQYLPLPSQHWEELVDAWMCHADQEMNQGMIDTQKKLHEHRDLQRGHARVSDACIILHPSHLTAEVKIEDENKLVSG